MSGYAIIIEPAAHNDAAYAPDLPGCVATGSTVEETLREMQAAIRLHLEGLREDGLEIPAPSSLAATIEG